MPGRLGLAVLLSLAATLAATAQSVTLRGQVTDAADGRPLTGASVQLAAAAGTRVGTASGAEGFFLLRLAPGAYAMTVTHVGYAAFVDTLHVGPSPAPLAVALVPDVLPVGEVTVRDGVRNARPEGGRMVTVRPADVRHVPALTPAPDLAAYLLTLPAFTPTGDRGGQVSVRGGEPTQNLFLVDGIPVYQPFHVLGELSVVPGEALAAADVYAGAFPARHGGRIASVVDVALRSGNKERFEVLLGAAPLLSAVQVEGPLVQGKVSALVSVRESFVSRVGLGVPSETLPFHFGDRLARVHASLTRTSTLAATVLRSADRASLRTGLGLGGEARWTTTGAGLRFTYLPTTFAVLAEVEVFGSRLDSHFDVGGRARRSLVEEGGANFGFRYLLGPSEVRFGIQARTDHLLTAGAGELEEYLTEGAVYLDGVLRRGAWRAEPGVRLSTFPSRSRVALEPRLRLEWSRGAHHLHGGAAVVHQEIGGRYTADDLADVFVAWVPAPAGAPLPRAVQLVAGWGRQGARTFASVEAYRRELRHLGTDAPLHGRAQGVELRAEARHGSVAAHLGGAWQQVRYRGEDGAAYAPPPDRPLRLDARVAVAHGGVEASARWFFTSGAAFTPLQGVYDAVPVVVGTDGHLHRPGVPTALDGTPGGRRLPSTHRLDVALRYTRAFRRARLAVQLALRNAYDRPNLFYLDRFTAERYDGLPRTLVLGLSLDV